MTRNRRKKNEQLVPDPGVALVAGDAFRRLSQPFLQKVGCDLTQQDLGALMASATTLALSVELYLKALRLLVGLNASIDHNLWTLFHGLRQDVKESIRRKYESLGPPKERGIDQLALQISVGPFSEVQRSDSAARKPGMSEGNSLDSVLKRNRDAFQTWRYLHEKGNPDGPDLFIYEFHYLGNAAEAIRQHVVARLRIPRKEVQPINGSQEISQSKTSGETQNSNEARVQNGVRASDEPRG